MKPRLRVPFLLIFVAAGFVIARADAAESEPPQHPLVWTALEQAIDVAVGDTVAEFTFTVRNSSDQPVEIVKLETSCGCTVADMPAQPWVLAPGASGSFRAVLDFKGKLGRVSKSIYAISNPGTQRLTATVVIPETPESRRLANQHLAAADRQAVFRGDCASCHAAPAAGKMGGDLFKAACAICHEAPHRASMVPDLAIAREPRNAEFWQRWITQGRANTLMPAFAQSHGGPLSTEQIESLVAYAVEAFPAQPSN